MPVSNKKVYFQFFFLFCKCIFDLYEHCKFEYVSQPTWDIQVGPILAVCCVPLSHKITCPFSKHFQILYIFAKIFKYFALFRAFLRRHWFWNGGLRNLLHTSTWHLGKFQAVSDFCFVTKERVAFKCSLDLHFHTLIIGFFRSA